MASIRFATPADVPVILNMVRLLAIYEREPDAVQATEADFLRDGFGKQPHFECLLAEERNENNSSLQVVGFALYFTGYSTWRGRPGIHLEDLFVLPEFRRRGIAKALLARVAACALEKGCDWLGWHVLEWNQLALDFYRLHGARTLTEWQIMRVSGEELSTLAMSAPGAD